MWRKHKRGVDPRIVATAWLCHIIIAVYSYQEFIVDCTCSYMAL